MPLNYIAFALSAFFLTRAIWHATKLFPRRARTIAGMAGLLSMMAIILTGGWICLICATFGLPLNRAIFLSPYVLAGTTGIAAYLIYTFFDFQSKAHINKVTWGPR